MCSSDSLKETKKSTTYKSLEILFSLIYYALLTNILIYFINLAYRIRLIALNEYGNVIHEFDPYFNYRATEYLYAHGWYKFRTWFDYMVWYPLGRPVGTTIYPGMQVTAVFIKYFVLKSWSINDICCFVPAWFGAIASVMTGLLAYECSLCRGGSIFQQIPFVGKYYDRFILKYQLKLTHVPSCEIMVCTVGVMSILPAHLMRSVGGGFDNEAVAITALSTTFYFWTKSLQKESTAIVYGLCTGLAYFYMVACWGGYVFVLNLIGAHAAFLIGIGRYSWKLYKSYTCFYALGTLLAIQVPVVGLTPLKSLEQMAPAALFLGIQLLAICELIRVRKKMSRVQAWGLRIGVFAIAALVGASLLYLLLPNGYFGPISSRVRGLFVKHTRTGNPLVDSVAEHQPADTSAYWRYLYYSMYIAPVGFGLIVLLYFDDSSSFLVVYAIAAYFFSHKMVRLVLLMGPVCAALSGVVLGRIVEFCWTAFVPFTPSLSHFNIGLESTDKEKNESEDDDTGKPLSAVPVTKGEKKNHVKVKATPVVETSRTKKTKNETGEKVEDKIQTKKVSKLYIFAKIVQIAISVVVMKKARPYIEEYNSYCWQIGKQMSHPTILYKAERNDGETVMVDDYREAYLWLDRNTPKDARILAWWDYGYQITGIGNRTTLADGNTWNHEHIALIGRILTGAEKDSHRIARHLADYVLIWAGGGGDDLAKSPHLARIANSVYRGLCPDGPTCRSFGFMGEGRPTPLMEQSLLFKLHQNGMHPTVTVDRNRFKEVYTSKYKKVRIYKVLSVSQESKKWVIDNRKCDVEGSWFCPGQYPPALNKILKEKKDFRQLEDFNLDTKHDEEYSKQYFEHMDDPNKARVRASSSGASSNKRKRKWEDTEETTMLYQLISQNSYNELEQWFKSDKNVPFARSRDGRGPMFWAYEFGHKDIIKLLKSYGVKDTVKDAKGKTAKDR